MKKKFDNETFKLKFDLKLWIMTIVTFLFVVSGQYPTYGISSEAYPDISTDKSPRTFFEKGVDQLKSGDPQKAVDLFTELIMVEPENAKARKNRGVALLKMGKADLAIKDFQKALELNPDLPGLYSNLGAAWYYKEKYKEAISSYDNELSKNPDSHISYFNRALSRIQLNQQKLALADITRCLELEPDFPGALSLKKMLDPTTGKDKKKSSEIPSGGFEIQTGAFLNKKNAVKMKELLEQKGLNPHILSLNDAKQRTWYRVRFKYFADREEGRRFCKEFIKQEKMDAIVCPQGKR